MPHHTVIITDKQPKEKQVLRTFLELLRMNQDEVRRANETLSETPEESLDSASEKQSQDTAAQKSSPKEN